MGKIKLILGASILLFGSICGASSIVLVEIEGVITDSEDRFDYVGFGAGDGVFDGKNINISLTYDTALNPLNTSNNPLVSFYSQINYPIWMTLPIVEIDGIAVEPPVPPIPGGSFDIDQRMNITPSEDKIRLDRDLDYQVYDINGDSIYFLDFGISPGDLFFEGLNFSVPEYLPADDFLSGSGTFFIDEDNSSGLLNSVVARFDVTSASFTTVESVPEPAAIDIKPGSDPNKINLSKKWKLIPVAVLGSIDFDATQIDYTTVKFGPAGASPANQGRVRDVNDDGFPDMKLKFKTGKTGISCGDTEATLTGETFGGVQITGTDAIKTVGCRKNKGDDDEDDDDEEDD